MGYGPWGRKESDTTEKQNNNTLFLKMKALVSQLSPTFGGLMDYSPPGSSVHRILQTRILEWVAMPSSRGSSPLRD